MHPLAAGRSRLDDAGPLEAGIPPVVKAVVAHWVVGPAANPVLDRLAVLGGVLVDTAREQAGVELDLELLLLVGATAFA